MSLFTLSAFADEISPDPQEQVSVLAACGVRHIEFRSIHGTNILALDDARIAEFKKHLDSSGFRLSAIGSPIGKIKITDPFEPHLEKFERAIYLAKLFGTPNIRIFSYYPPDEFDGNWAPYRDEVLRRLRLKTQIAEQHSIILFHENEHRIFGDSPERITDLFNSVQSPNFKAAYDPANFVFCGYDPLEGWKASKPHLAHLHIKDWRAGESHGALAGEGEGQISRIIAEAANTGYRGFATLEPHLLGGGPTGGVTGPELFPKAVSAFKAILETAGASYA